VEPELEVKGAAPELDTESNETTKELGEKKREPYKPFHPFLVDFETIILR